VTPQHPCNPVFFRAYVPSDVPPNLNHKFGDKLGDDERDWDKFFWNLQGRCWCCGVPGSVPVHRLYHQRMVHNQECLGPMYCFECYGGGGCGAIASPICAVTGVMKCEFRCNFVAMPMEFIAMFAAGGPCCLDPGAFAWKGREPKTYWSGELFFPMMQRYEKMNSDKLRIENARKGGKKLGALPKVARDVWEKYSMAPQGWCPVGT
jgi:hypothetical protein